MSEINKQDFDKVRRLLAAVVSDLVAYLRTLPEPIIIGASYSEEKFYKAVAQWSILRNLSVANPDSEAWFAAVLSGCFLGEEDADSTTQSD